MAFNFRASIRSGPVELTRSVACFGSSFRPNFPVVPDAIVAGRLSAAVSYPLRSDRRYPQSPGLPSFKGGREGSDPSPCWPQLWPAGLAFGIPCMARLWLRACSCSGLRRPSHTTRLHVIKHKNNSNHISGLDFAHPSVATSWLKPFTPCNV